MKLFKYMFRSLRSIPIMVMAEGDGGDGGGGDGDGGGKTWHEGLPEDIRADASLVDFKDETEMVPMPINVARSYIATKKLVGRDKIPMPTTPEEWETTYQRLGKPEAPSQYNIPLDGIENPQLKEMATEEAEWFKEQAHKNGLNDTQANGIWSAYLGRTGEKLTQNTKSIEEQLHESETTLRTTYGNSFEGKMVLMNRGIDELDRRVGGGLKDMVTGMELSRDSTFVKAMVIVGEMMAEDLGLDKNTGEEAVSQESLDTQIKELQASKAYLDAKDSGHALTVDKVAKLMQIKHGKKPVDAMTRQSFIT